VLLLRNKDQEYNKRLASFATCLCSKGANCALTLSLSGASRSPLCRDGPRVHLTARAYMPSCIGPEVRFPLDQRILCSDCCKVKKRKLLCLSLFSLYCIATRYLWCLRPKLHIWADSQIELIV